MHGLNTLAPGIIPTELVSPSDVRSALDKVKTNLYLNNRSFKVVHDDVSFYMQNHVSSYTKNNIYIHMQVPISDNDIIYEIYQTNVFTPYPSIIMTHTILAIRSSPMPPNYSQLTALNQLILN